GVDPIAKFVQRFVPERYAHRLLRWKNVLLTLGFYQLSRRRPELAKKLIRKGVEHRLPAGYDVDKHFKPNYNPWDQRVCLVPDGDLFASISRGEASVVNEKIDLSATTGI